MTLATKELPDGDIMEAIYHEPKYNEQAKALDQSAEMGKHLLGLVHFGRSINFPYDQLVQHKDYKEGFIILARLRRSGIIIGKICGVIKDIYLFEKQEKAVYIFDLRVPTTIQKKGVGSFLLQTAENISKSRGVTVQLMSINKNNVKIENLSNKFGWQNGCARKIMTTSYDSTAPLITGKQQQQGFKLQFFQPKQVKNDLVKKDLSLVNFKELSQCKNYLGQLRASTQQSEARLHLYRGDKQFGMVCKRFFFEPETFNYLHTWIFLIFLFLAGPFYLVLTSINLKFQIHNATRLALGAVGVILFSFLLYGLRYAINMLNSPFIRVFGYQFKGNSEQQQLVCEQVHQMARRYAATTKASVRLNQDPRAEYLPFLKGLFKAFGTTIFKYKFINQNKVERYYDQNNFFDPRDL